MERRVASDVDPDSVMDQQARPSSEAAEEASQVVHEDALRSLKNKRKAKLEQLLRQRSKIHQFMDEDCYSVVEDRMLPAFYQLLKELCDINDSLKETYQERKLEDDMEIDQDWFDTRLSALRGRGDDIACRLIEVRQRREEARKANESVAPEDSVSVASTRRSRKSRTSSVTSSATKACLKAEIERAELLARAEALKQRHAIEQEEARLRALRVQEEAKFKAEKEELEMNAALAAAKARSQIMSKRAGLTESRGPNVGTDDFHLSQAKTTYAGEEVPVVGSVAVQIERAREEAKKGNKVITLYAFLDPGSTATFCTDELLDELNLRGKKVSLIVTTMTESKVVTSTMVTELEVGHLNSNTFIELKEVFSQKAIPVSRNNIPRQEDIDKWPHLKGVQVPLIDAAIGLLIGTDAAKMMEPKEVIPSVDDGPFAVRTILGWTVNGPLKVDGCNTSRNEIMQAVSNRVSVARLEDLWKQQFKYDFPEDGQEERYEMSKADRLFMERVRQSARLVDGHYCLDLPLKELNIKMPNNRAVAEQRATTLKRKFLRNPSFRADYITFMNDTITKKYAVKVPIEDLGRCDGKVWYIPHHGVYHPKKLKLRVVFDCGASYQGTSLNEQLLQGPNLTSTIIGVLTRFRQEPVTIVADVEAMFHQLTDFGIERCFKPKDFGQTVSAQLHHFADASENGYGTVTYLVQRNISNQAHSAFVLGKARVAPLKPMTIPRLELTAATLAVRIDKMLRKELELPLEDSVYWTDSTAVLKYISNETSRFRTFVANRVSAIQQTSTVSQWHYVNSHLNPADGASRGQKVKAFLRNKLWVSGPDFLTQAAGNWPRNPDSQEIDLDVADPEVKRNVTVNVLAVEESTDIVQRLMEYYSSWTRLKRAVAWFLRLKDMLLTSSRRRKGLLQNTVQNIQLRRKKLNYKTRKKNLTVDELKEAEVDIIRHCQRKSFPDEISSLLKGEAVKRSSHIHRLNPVLQDGILRVGGRLSRAAMPEESKHPAILAKNHRVSQLILQDIHERIGHGGRNHVLSTLRQRYWIPNAISAIRKILSSCRTCRRLHGATGRQQMADLPLSRVLPDEPPFTRTGVDCFGPFTIKRGRTTAKRYGVIFTCMATRAVHIEVAASLDTDSFINALRRFIARRGQVLEIHSDNGTNFVGAERELKRSLEEWNMSKIENRLTQSGIKWMFNPPSASHFGGVWERLIRSVRKVLSATLKDQSLDEEGLQTLLCEVEAILNSRPITTPSDDPNDLEALTPNHLLLLKTQPSIPQGVFQEDDLYSRRRWRQVQYMADLFWKRWVKEYLPELQRRQKWTHAKRNFVPGDIVLIVDESAPRNSWVIGRIIHAIQDERGLVRQVRIKTRTNEFDRPITKVCLLQESE
ncbi:hypothetical protein Q8A73_008418 [Channa argus]|nr:hypothetical protein Q8A73_008418 [Channa argus]